MARFEPERAMAKLRQVRDVPWHECSAGKSNENIQVIGRAWRKKCPSCNVRLMMLKRIRIYECNICESKWSPKSVDRAWGCDVCKSRQRFDDRPWLFFRLNWFYK